MEYNDRYLTFYSILNLCPYFADIYETIGQFDAKV